MDPSSLSIVVVWQDAILSFVAYIGGLSDFFSSSILVLLKNKIF